MVKLNLADVSQYVENNIGHFHQRRIQSLDDLKLKDVLKRKNPYLYKAKNVLTAQDIVKGIVDAHISSQEETIFGDWLERLAIFINNKVYGGNKSSTDGIDLEFDNSGIRYIVAIKSGPHWANKSQKAKMLSDFSDAKKRIQTSGHKANIVCVNGCCYGRDGKPHKFPAKGIDYLKLCGQDFWEFISGDPSLYLEIIEPLGHKAKEKNDDFNKSYAIMINKFTAEFLKDFCKTSGEIDWDKLVKFNSEKRIPKAKKVPTKKTPKKKK
ncbi:MAG: cytosolic protein [Bacteroidetes bacterium]|nr:cytosolic protein [Bacteroidota bacterium]